MNLEFVKEIKNKFTELSYEYEQYLDMDVVTDDMFKVFSINKKYFVIIRISYLSQGKKIHTQYKMLGDQIIVNKDNEKDLLSFVYEIYKVINDRLEASMDIYKYSSSDILTIQILVYTLGKVKIGKPIKYTTKSLGEQKDLVNTSEVSKGFNVIPLLPKEYDFGILLDKKVVNDILYVSLPNNVLINVNEFLNNNKSKHKHINFTDKMYYYLKEYKDKKYLVVKDLVSVLETKVLIYSLSGIFIQSLILGKEGINHTRKVGNVKIFIDKKGIYKEEVDISFNSVYPRSLSKKLANMVQPDWRFGTLDVETYRDNDINKVFAIGFYVSNSINTYYIDENLNSDLVIIKCIDAMLVDKYNGYSFYVHNFHGYDVYFIYRVLLLYPEKYIVTECFRDSSIISLKISVKKISSKNMVKVYTIKIVDSYLFLQNNLADLCITYNTEVKKSYFPYDLINKNNLFYVGQKPSLDYFETKNNLYNFGSSDIVFNNMKKKNIDLFLENERLSILEKDLVKIFKSVDLLKFYVKLDINNWSVKDQTIIYLENDLISLYNVIEKFIYNIYRDYHVHVGNSLTISSLSMNIYLRRFYNNNIPLIKDKSIYNNIKSSYYGGITEVYKPFGENLYYYDVNSLYPYSSLNSMPGLHCVYVNNINEDISLLLNTDFFGFYYCKIIAPKNDYLGLLPYRINIGLIMPLGSFEGWYFSEELKFAYNNGYSIHVVKGYKFDKVDKVFDNYVLDLYKIKSTSKDKVERSIVKSLLNNLLGRFGMDITKCSTHLLTEEEFLSIGETRRIKDVKYIDTNKILTTYDTEVSKEICEMGNLDFKEQLLKNMNTKHKSLKEDDYNNVSVAISSAVTSYARIYMNKIKLDILNKGGSLYYMDTDSIITNIKLEDNLVGNNIGQFKLEDSIKVGYFISNKTYAYKTFNGKTVLKNKGTITNFSKYEDYNSLYSGENVKGFRYESHKDYIKGSVTLYNPRSINISPNSYKKRVKIFDSKHWIDTKPMKINEKSFSTLYNNFSKKKLNWFLKKFLKVIGYSIKYSIYILLLLLIVIILIILISLDEDTEVSSNIVNLTQTVEHIDVKKDKNNLIFQFIKNEWNSFLELFLNNNNYNIKHYDNIILKKEDILEDTEKVKINIIDNLTTLYLDKTIKENDELKRKISLLEWHLIQQRVHILDHKYEINNLIRDLERTLHIKVNTPLIN